MTVVATIDTAAMARNAARFRELTESALVMAIVKANGYGHGVGLAARAALAGGVDALGVVDLDEALHLREDLATDGLEPPILCWMHGSRFDPAAATRANITLGVSSLEQLDECISHAESAGDRVRVHFKVETGLGRNGLPPADWCEAFERAQRASDRGLLDVEGIFSHLANAGETADHAQAAEFDRAVALADEIGLAPRLFHLAATEGSLGRPETKRELTRLGIALYGLSPLAGQSSADLGLTPAMTLTATVTAEGAEGEIDAGFAHGLPSRAAGAAEILVGGLRCPVVTIGPVSSTVDLSATRARVGDEVTVWGDPAIGAPSANDWARASGTINYEIVTRVSSRVCRVDAASGERVETRDWSGVDRLGPRRELLIDLAQLRSNIDRAVAAGALEISVAADGFGHGVELARQLIREAGAEPVDSMRADAAASAYGLVAFGTPALTLWAEVIKRQEVGAQHGISYGYDFVTSRDTSLALVPLGYADGIPRAVSGQGALVVIDGAAHPVLGRIAMDQFVIDVTGASVEVGDSAIVFGSHSGVTLHDWAAWAGATPAEIAVRIGQRVERRVI